MYKMRAPLADEFSPWTEEAQPHLLEQGGDIDPEGSKGIGVEPVRFAL
jgi:hypothetical protein